MLTLPPLVGLQVERRRGERNFSPISLSSASIASSLGIPGLGDFAIG
jgi:hypothetical protein